MEFEFKRTGAILEVHTSGTYSIQDIQYQFEPLLNRQTGKGHQLLVVDATDSKQSPSAEDLQAVAAFASTLLGRITPKIALVVPDDFRFGLGRMLEIFGEDAGLEFRVFHKRLDALNWLSPERC